MECRTLLSNADHSVTNQTSALMCFIRKLLTDVFYKKIVNSVVYSCREAVQSALPEPLMGMVGTTLPWHLAVSR